MKSNPLNPDELVVTSFETESAAAYPSPITVITINDPTAATRCFICPVDYSYDRGCI